VTDHIDVHVAETAGEARRIRAASADLATYGHVAVVVALDPDNPSIVRSTVDVTPGAPCWRQAAKALRDIAEQLEQRHRGGPCGVHR